MPGSIFGWSLPAGVSRLPGEEPEPVQPRCNHCGAFLPWEADKTEPWEQWSENRENEPYLLAAGHWDIWTCRKCNKEVRVNIW